MLASPVVIYSMTRVIFFGNERLVSGLHTTDAPILHGLIEKGYEVVAVVSHHSESKSRNERKLEVADIAKDNNIPLFIPNRPSEIIDDLRKLNAEVAVLAAYGRIISQEIIDLFPKGIINIHPSLLPKYRGPTPIESVILNGDQKTGVSIMQLTAGMDEGPVYAQERLELSGSESKFELYKKITNLATPLFFEKFSEIIDASLSPQPQNNTEATYSKLIEKKDGNIDWNKSAVQIEREVRTYLNWPQSKTKLGQLDVIITKAHIISGNGQIGQFSISESDVLSIGTGTDLLVIDEIKPAGKKEMPISAFLTGYKSQLLN
jgi:methionyl-tRNA formyltransferase